MRRYLRVLVALLVVAAGCSDGRTTDPLDPFANDTAPDIAALLAGLAMDSGLARITAADMAHRIGLLAHDSMQGRLTGEPALERAAAYIAAELAGLGLEPLGSAPEVAGTEAYMVRWDLPMRFLTEWDDSLASRPPNVAAVLRGSDPGLAGHYVVVTAHFDHVGVGAPYITGDSIYNGADDNASGTAVLLEVAEALASLPTAPRRPVLFLAVSGEELGLLGSGAYVESPTVPVESMVANVNLDMVSRGGDGVVWVVGYGLSTLGLLADAVADQIPAVGLDALSDQYLGTDLISRSDHFWFAASRVPAVGMFGGFHPDYHTPADEVERIDPEKAARVGWLTTYLVATVATLDDPPRWTSLGQAVLGGLW